MRCSPYPYRVCLAAAERACNGATKMSHLEDAVDALAVKLRLKKLGF